MMVTHHSDEERISRMHGEGKLTQEQADRLLESIRAQQTRDAVLAKQITQRTERTRRQRLLLVFFSVLLAIGIAGYGLLMQQPDGSAALDSVKTTSAIADQPRGRLI
ncbi:MAG: hypothetical protein WBN81_16055, partial [Gammaproteobacteria bacterium]